MQCVTHSESHLPKSLMPWVSVTRGTSLGSIVAVAILGVLSTLPGGLDDRNTLERVALSEKAVESVGTIGTKFGPNKAANVP
jgi:hypothetical protein